LGLRRTEENGCFKKGHKPANSGKKMTSEQYAKCSRTMFKKGRNSLNKRPLGSTRITKDGYIEIKTAEPNVWSLKHRIEWQKHHGEIPKGEAVCFVDGDKTNCKIDNLELKSNIRRMLENSHQNYPKEIIPTKELICKINNQLKNKNNGKITHTR
jgi:hypothetical protein